MITVAATASDLDGSFVVGFEGHWSEKINHDATAAEVASALAGIPAVGDVEVIDPVGESVESVRSDRVRCTLLSLQCRMPSFLWRLARFHYHSA